MKKFAGKFRIGSHRLQGWNYANEAAYFITVVTQNRHCILGQIQNKKMILSDFGEIVKTEWLKSFDIRKELFLDEYVIMPNHFHAIVILKNIEDERLQNFGSTKSINPNNRDINDATFRLGDDETNRFVVDESNRFVVDESNHVGDDDTNRFVDDESNRLGDDETNRFVDDETNRFVDDETNRFVDDGVDTYGRTYLHHHQQHHHHHHHRNQPPYLIRMPKSISSFMAGFKSGVNSKIDDFIDQNHLDMPKYDRNNHFFQQNYFDRIIRNQDELMRIRNYIIDNPKTWKGW